MTTLGATSRVTLKESKMAWVAVAAFAQALRSCVEGNVYY